MPRWLDKLLSFFQRQPNGSLLHTLGIVASEPLRWRTSDVFERAMLEDLQANIIKSHGRNHVALVFLRFEDGSDLDELKAFVGAVGGSASAAWDQLRESQRFRDEGVPGATVVNVGLSAEGYSRLGYNGNGVPTDAAFRAGMRRRQEILGDSVADAWSVDLRPAPHLVVAFADDSLAEVDVRVRWLQWLLNESVVRVVAEVRGASLHEAIHQNTVEHFGYVDGRGQPLMLQEDVAKDTEEDGGGEEWNPAFPLETVLAPDPNGEGPASYGSYFVFRKLEQDVAGFKSAEARLAAALGLVGDDTERAGALVVGRFEDGTPLMRKDRALCLNPVPNDFNYDDDPAGAKCPFASHIRKVNPRSRSDDERRHLFPRRGIPYDERPVEEQEARPSAGELATRGGEHEEKEPGDFPSGGVGLLFMCYNSNIENQFEYMQRRWANDPDYVRAGTGIDPIIGQADDHAGQLWPAQQGDVEPVRFDFGKFVTMKGGEYFFMPSISFLKSLKPPEPKDEFSDLPIG